MSFLGLGRPRDGDADGGGDAEGSGAISRGWRLLPRALHYLRPYRPLAAVSIALTVALALVALAEPWPLAFIVDTVLAAAVQVLVWADLGRGWWRARRGVPRLLQAAASGARQSSDAGASS